jgi:CMP/dCMP kinase
MAVITISRQYGSGGDQVAELVSKTLGYRLFDKRLIAQAAEEEGISESMAVDYNEDTHEVQSILERLFHNYANAAQRLAWLEDPTLASKPEAVDLNAYTAVGLVKRAVKAGWQMGNMVILGRAGQVLLRDAPNTLHIRIEAPLEDRIQRVKGLMKQEKKDYSATIDIRREAQDLIIRRDTASADYLKRFFDVDWADPLLYHLLINTSKVTIEQAALLIVDLVKEMEKTPIEV